MNLNKLPLITRDVNNYTSQSFIYTDYFLDIIRVIRLLDPDQDLQWIRTQSESDSH